MGSSNSREGGKKPKVTSSAYHAKTGLGDEKTPLSEAGDRRSDGAVEVRAVHEGAILGIARCELLFLSLTKNFNRFGANGFTAAAPS